MAAAKKTAPAAKAAPPASKALTKPKAAALAEFEVGQDILAQDAAEGAGFGKDDLAIPFLRVLQDLSPQVKKKDEGYVPGAAVGMLYNTVTKQLWEGEEAGILVLPVHYTPSYIEWKPARGGFAQDHGADASIMQKTKRVEKENGGFVDQLPNGNIISKNGLYYLFVIDEEAGSFDMLAYPMGGTQLKKSRAWNTRMQSLKVESANGGPPFTPAPFYMAYRIKTAYESNDQGSWYGVNIEPEKPILDYPFGAGIYMQAREFKKLITAGQVNTQQPIDDAEGVEIKGGDDGAY